jgi:ClpP class serine protease
VEKIYICEPSFLEDWQNKKLNISQSDFKAASELYLKLKKERGDIYEINGDTIKINISGPLTNEGPDIFDMYYNLGGTGYNEIMNALELADDEQIKNIIGNFNTPGGEVGIIDNVWNRLFELRNNGKNYIAINKGLMASAGYYLACPANKILSDGKANRTGSIGVVLTAVDYSNAYKKVGIVVKDITSSNAKNKRPDIKTKDGMSVLQEQVDTLENVFIDRVARGRGITREKVIENYGQGKVFITENPDMNGVDAIRAGMIDGLVTKPDAVATGKNNSPAAAGSEVKKMPTFLEMLASDPAYKAEFEKLLQQKYDAGVVSGKTEESNRIKALMPFVQSEAYDSSFKTQIFKGLTGEYSVETVKAMIGMEDARLEREKSTTAQTSTANVDIPKDPPMKLSADGSISNPLDIDAESKRLKAASEGK